MDKNTFWSIIDKVNETVSHSEHEAVLRETVNALITCSREDILDWCLLMEQYKRAANRNDLWAASAAMGAHYNDDGFDGFRNWLISCGRKVYMAALHDPDSLADVNTYGEDINVGPLDYAAGMAYGAVYSNDLYKRLKSHTLAPQTVAEIEAELPQQPDINKDWSEETLPQLFPRIWDQHKMQLYKLLLENGDLIYANVYKKKMCDRHMFENTPENIAFFLSTHSRADKIVLTDTFDQLILSTIGISITNCPDQGLLEEIKKMLIPIQTSEVPAVPFFCPTKVEVSNYSIQKDLEEEESSCT